jgi:hypothetical protein
MARRGVTIANKMRRDESPAPIADELVDDLVTLKASDAVVKPARRSRAKKKTAKRRR